MEYFNLALQVGSIVFALTAAIVAASVALDGRAEHILNSVNARGEMDVFGSDFNSLLNSLISDGMRNAGASIFAALAALSQGLVLLLEWKKPR